MTLLNAWAVGFAAVAPVIVLLYLLKLKRRPIPVSTLQFWQRVLQENRRRAFFQRLRQLFSLLLHLLIFALILGALLRYHQFEVHVIQVLDPAELRPTATGDLRLVESETSEAYEVTATESILRRYHAEIDGFLEKTASFCVEKGIAYAQATTAVPFEDLVLRVLRDGRMIQ